MDTRTVGELSILTPDLDPRDLDDIADPPEDDLIEAKVEGADWARLQLAGTQIRRSHLLGVSLTEAAWRNVTLYGCRFERVDFSSARLAALTIERCEFIGCRMTGVQLSETTLKNVLFEECRLDYANLDQVRATGPVAWTGCNLDHAALTNCRLPSVVIRESSLGNLELRDCDLRGADLRQNDVSEMEGLLSLRGIRLTGEQVVGLAGVAVRELGIEVG